MKTHFFSRPGIFCLVSALATIILANNTKVHAETERCPLYKKIVKEARDLLGWKSEETSEYFYCEHSFEGNFGELEMPAFLLKSNEGLTVLHHMPCVQETVSTGYQIYVYGTEKLEILTEGQSDLYDNLYEGKKETFHGYEAYRTSARAPGVNKRELKWKVGKTWFIVNKDIASCHTLKLEDPDQLAEALYKAAVNNGLSE